MKYLFLLLGSFLVSTSFAQKMIGVRGSISGSKVTKFDLIENITPDFKLMPAGGAAVFMELPITEKFSFQPELAYTQKGFRIAEGIDMAGDFLGVNIPINGSVNFRTDYVEIPLLAKVHFGDKNEAHYYMMAGTAVGFLTDASMRISVLNIFPVRTGLSTGFFKDAELSGIAAAGFQMPVSEKMKFFTEVRYQHGFTRILDTPVVQLPVRNRTFSGGMGFMISI